MLRNTIEKIRFAKRARIVPGSGTRILSAYREDRRDESSRSVAGVTYLRESLTGLPLLCA